MRENAHHIWRRIRIFPVKAFQGIVNIKGGSDMEMGSVCSQRAWMGNLSVDYRCMVRERRIGFVRWSP